MPMTRFNFVKVPTRDLAAQLAFYEAAFGFAHVAAFENDEMEEILAKQEGADFQLCLMRLKAPPTEAKSMIGVIGFVTDAIDAALHRALDAGADLKQSVFEVDGIRIALLWDPEGNEIELVQFG
jgi:predicted enzyme related to lactoylglutathione lyase